MWATRVCGLSTLPWPGLGGFGFLWMAGQGGGEVGEQFVVERFQLCVVGLRGKALAAAVARLRRLVAWAALRRFGTINVSIQVNPI